MLKYELVSYDENSNDPKKEWPEFRTDSAAFGYAGRLAKRRGGPVDVARYEPGAEWADRYLTTASPSRFHAKGYRFERLT